MQGVQKRGVDILVELVYLVWIRLEVVQLLASKTVEAVACVIVLRYLPIVGAPPFRLREEARTTLCSSAIYQAEKE